MNFGVFVGSKTQKKSFLVFGLWRLKITKTNHEFCSSYSYEYYKLLLLVMVVRLSVGDDFENWVGGCHLTLFMCFCTYRLITITLVMDYLPNEVVYSCSLGIILHVHNLKVLLLPSIRVFSYDITWWVRGRTIEYLKI